MLKYILFLFSLPILAQTNAVVVFVTSAPTGACSTRTSIRYRVPAGILYVCVNNVWTAATSGGGGAGTVTNVSGTTSEINVATGTTTPVISLNATAINDTIAACTDVGASDTYACSTPIAIPYVTNSRYRFKANTANTGAATINFNAQGAKTIVKVAGGITTALADSDIRVGQVVDLVYDGTNMQIQSTLGNASGAFPAGSTTEMQYRLDATHFGASAQTYNATDQSFSTSSSSTSQNVKFYRYVATGDPAMANTGILTAGYFEMDSNNALAANQVVGLHAEADALSTGNLGELGGFQSYAFNSSSGTITNEYGSYLFVEDSSAATVTNLYGEWIAFLGADGGGNITNLAGVWIDSPMIGMGSTVASLYGFHMAAPTVDGTLTNSYGLWLADFSGSATNPYYSWFDSRGVRRVKEDSTFNSVGQAIEALYNPQFTKYTPGATDYERVVLGQWSSDVAQIGNEAGGTGTLRQVQEIGNGWIATPYAFASLGSLTNGTYKYCSDCTVTSSVDNTCVASGSGAWAERVNGAWKCSL